MRIIIARHAKAEDNSDGDAGRKLTPEGREQAQLLGKVLKATGQVPDEIWTSPLVRCAQTAEIASKELGGRIPLKTVQELAPGAEAEQIAFMAGRSGRAMLMICGHSPDVGFLGARLLGFNGEHHLKKGAFTLIEIQDPLSPPGRGVATLEPRQYRAILKGEMYIPWTKSNLIV